MRRIEFLVYSAVPKRQVGWLQLADAIRSQWAAMSRQKFLGNVAIGFTWKNDRPLGFQSYGRIWTILAKAIVPLVGGAPHLGESRFIIVSAVGEPQLTITIEGN